MARTPQNARRTTTRSRTPAAEVRFIEHWQRQGGRYPQPELAARIEFHRRALARAHQRRTRRTQWRRIIATLARIRPFR